MCQHTRGQFLHGCNMTGQNTAVSSWYIKTRGETTAMRLHTTGLGMGTAAWNARMLLQCRFPAQLRCKGWTIWKWWERILAIFAIDVNATKCTVKFLPRLRDNETHFCYSCCAKLQNVSLVPSVQQILLKLIFEVLHEQLASLVTVVIANDIKHHKTNFPVCHIIC